MTDDQDNGSIYLPLFALIAVFCALLTIRAIGCHFVECKDIAVRER